MTDRDHFAAAALTRLLVGCPFNTDAVPRLAYSMADAMLSERERARSYEKNDEARSFSDMEWSAIPKEKDATFTYSTTSPPVSSGSAESQSPDAKCGGGEPLGDTRPDTKGEATGGRGRFLAAQERMAIASTLRALLERTK